MTLSTSVIEERHIPSTTQLFRYSAVTWNSHRIHYDQTYAHSEGYPDVLVQSHLHGAFLTKLCTDWAGGPDRLSRLQISVRHFAIPGDVLLCRARIVDEKEQDNQTTITLEIEEVREADGMVCATGQATIVLPERQRQAVENISARANEHGALE